ncbi:MAG: type II toxin-antitoxin system PemK/MazF family toxin [Planctomycetaceae bacterium]
MKLGEVRIAKFPTVDGSPPKSRPVVVIQADFYNSRIRNVLVAQITSTLARQNDPAHLFIDISTPEGKQTGLQTNSLVSCINIAVLSQHSANRKIGELTDDMMSKLDDCIRAAFGV